MRQSFYSPSPSAERTTPPAEPTGKPEPRASVRGFIKKHERLLLVAGGVLVSMLSVLLFALLRPAGEGLTADQVNEALAETAEAILEMPSPSAAAYAAIAPSVVRVSRYGEDDSVETSVGTGVIIDATGIILTSHHVVAGPQRITVTFIDGFQTEAEILAAQPENDIAALQVAVVPEGVIPATLTNTRGLRPGDTVVAVGNPFGIGNSVSAGVVSGLNRTYVSDDDGASFSGLIQFDAAANPGNSGGPLVNRNGEVLGIVSAILNPTELGVFIGIGFAVPIESAARAGGPNPF